MRDPMNTAHDAAPMLPCGAGPMRVVFRPLVRTDRGFFANNYLKSFQRADAARGISSRTYFYFQHRVLERLFARSKVIIACDEADPDQLYGFAFYEQIDDTCVLHYVYVRGGRRQLGVGSALLNEVTRACEVDPATPPLRALVWTHRTKGFDRWIRRHAGRAGHGLAMLYNPYLIDERNR